MSPQINLDAEILSFLGAGINAQLESQYSSLEDVAAAGAFIRRMFTEYALVFENSDFVTADKASRGFLEGGVSVYFFDDVWLAWGLGIVEVRGKNLYFDEECTQFLRTL